MQRRRVLGVVAAAVVAVAVALIVVFVAGGSGDDKAGERPEEAATATSSTTNTTSTTTDRSSSTTAAGAATTTTSAAAAGGDPLRYDGYGRYRVGMTLQQSGLHADPNSSPDPSSCAFAPISDGVNAMFASDRLVRIDVGGGSRVQTEAGLGIGATEAQVKRTYGDRVTVQAHQYDELGHYLLVRDPARPNLLLLFETDGNRVTTFRSGERNAVEAPEGCS